MTDGNTMDNDHGKEGGRRSMVATMANNGNGDGDGNDAKEGYGCSRYDWRAGDDGGNGPWFVCVFLCVERDHKK